jgi:iron complex outermembrane receptor protein
MSGSAVEGPLDEFGSISFRLRDGFREHSRENTEILFADAGYKLSEQVENRFYLTLDRTDRELPGGLTKSEMENTPWQANPLAAAQDWNKNWSYVRLADKLSIRIEEIQFRRRRVLVSSRPGTTRILLAGFPARDRNVLFR